MVKITTLLTNSVNLFSIITSIQGKGAYSLTSQPTKAMNAIKKFLGILWIAMGLAAAWFSITTLGVPKLTSGKQEDLVFGIIIVFVLTPIVTGGLLVFGRYALQGEYDL